MRSRSGGGQLREDGREASAESVYQDVALGSLCADVSYGLTASAEHDLSDGVHFLRITDIVGRSFDWTSVPFCSSEAAGNEKYSLQDGDICRGSNRRIGWSVTTPRRSAGGRCVRELPRPFAH